MINEIIQRASGKKKLFVKTNQRVLIIEEGEIKDMVGPGIHWPNVKHTEFVTFDMDQPRFTSPYAHNLFAKHPKIVEANFIEVAPNENEIALVESYGQIVDVVLPDQRRILWKDAAEWQIETISIADSSEISRELAKRLHRAGQTAHVSMVEVRDGSVGLLTLDGVFAKQLEPGTYWFWNLMKKHEVKLIDLRWQNHEVNGQEVLTQDRVTIRVNLNATYRVIDPLLATQSVKDFSEAMHNALQLAFRKTIAAITLDKLLAERAEIDKATSSGIKAEMKKIGIELGEISLKDVILPGEMRDILNQVVTAQKEAEANVIRRREETNATRSLLNTAKVMADNPVMIRLKELEALEKLSEKIDSLTVHSGTQGLLDEIVKLRD